MGTRASVARRSAMGLALLVFVTSCLAPEQRRAARPASPISDRQLLRRLAPELSEGEIAALPTGASDVEARPHAASAPLPFLAQPASSEDGLRARDCLTAAVYYEARSEPVEGQRAVAQVVLNRVRDRAFPHSVCGVVYQGSGSGKGCQFSFACDGATLRPREGDAWSRAERVAVAALNGGVMAAVGTATFYHAAYMLPWWASSLTRLGAVGGHVFYRWPGALERALGMRARYAGVEPGVPAQAGDSVVARSTSDFGVRVHRGQPDRPGAIDAPPVAMRPAVFTGVRIHRGEEAPPVFERAGDVGT